MPLVIIIRSLSFTKCDERGGGKKFFWRAQEKEKNCPCFNGTLSELSSAGNRESNERVTDSKHFETPGPETKDCRESKSGPCMDFVWLRSLVMSVVASRDEC